MAQQLAFEAPDDGRVLDGRDSDSPLLLTVVEAGRLLGIGRSKAYELIAAGELHTVHIGRACRVPWAEVERFVRRLRCR